MRGLLRCILLGGLLLTVPGVRAAPGEKESLQSIGERWEELQSRQAWPEAEALLTRALRDYPDQAWIADCLALTYIKLGEAQPEYAAGLPYFERAFRLRPGTDFVILNYALALNNVERYEDAVRVYRQGMAQHPAYEHLPRNLVWTLVRYAQSVRERDPERAFSLAREAYAVDARHAGAMQLYGELLVERGDAAQALPILRDGQARFPESRAFCWPLSLAYRALVEQSQRAQRPAEALRFAREIPAQLRGEPRCDNSLVLAIDASFAALSAFEEGMRILEELAARYPGESLYTERAGFHVNRYAVWLRTRGKTERATEMRARANVLLRRAMKLYEAAHPNRPRLTQPVRFPLDQLSLVVASPDSGGTHSGYGKYCYDLIEVGPNGAAVRSGLSGDQNEHFYGFGAPVYAVRAGEVDVAHDGESDPPPNGIQYQSDGNFVRVKHADGSFSWYAHLKNGSVRVRPGQVVSAGDPIGALGNSGMSVSPHLHFCMVTDDYVSLDFRFESLAVRRDINAPVERTGGPLEMGWLVRRAGP